MSLVPSHTVKAYMHLHFLIVIWSFTAILGRLISIPSIEIVVYRTLIAFFGMWILLNWTSTSTKVTKRQMFTILATGALIGLHWIAFFLAARLSNISICLAGLATTSFWTSLLDPIVNKRPIRWHEPFLGLLAVLGIIVVFDAAVDRYLGLFVAISSALFAAIFMIINARLISTYDYRVISYYEMLGAFTISLVILPVYSNYVSFRAMDFAIEWTDGLYLLILGGVCTVYAHTQGVKLMKQLSAFSINLTVNLEPVYGIVLAVLLFKDEESMDVNFYFGTSMIFVSLILYPIFRRRYAQKNFDNEPLY